MPELPDLTVVAEALHAALAGRPVTLAEALAPLAVRGTPAELTALSGQRVERVARRGKFLIVDLERDAIVVNPMLTGRFQLAAPGTKHPTKTAVVLAFGRRGRPGGAVGTDSGRRRAGGSDAAAGVPLDAASWTADASWLPADNALVEVRYRDPTQMGKVYLRPAGVERPIPGLGEDQGPDADDPALTLEVWRARIKRHPGELKNLLRNQAFVAGIGNAYSDEILHAARLLPFRTRASLAPEEVDELYASMRTTIARALDVLRARVPPTFEKQVRDFLAVHDKGGQACPRCGTHITEIRPGGMITSYCRGCQR